MFLLLLNRFICAALLLISSLCYAKNREQPKVGLLLSSMKEQRYLFDKSYFLRMARHNGYEAHFRSAQNSHNIQMRQASDLIEQGVEVIILQAYDSELAVNIVEYASNKGVAIVSYDRTIPSSKTIGHVFHDSFGIGKRQAEAILPLMVEENRILVCGGDKANSVATQINNAITQTLDPERVEIFHNRQWSKLRCEANVLKSFRKKSYMAILANNSQMADGAIAALKKLNIEPKSIFVAGADATRDSCHNILQGYQDLDFHKPIEPLMQAAMEIVGNYLQKNTSISKRQVKVPVLPITKKNLDKHFKLPSCEKKLW